MGNCLRGKSREDKATELSETLNVFMAKALEAASRHRDALDRARKLFKANYKSMTKDARIDSVKQYIRLSKAVAQETKRHEYFREIQNTLKNVDDIQATQRFWKDYSKFVQAQNIRHDDLEKTADLFSDAKSNVRDWKEAVDISTDETVVEEDSDEIDRVMAAMLGESLRVPSNSTFRIDEDTEEKETEEENQEVRLIPERDVDDSFPQKLEEFA
jgi:hypothetical protein